MSGGGGGDIFDLSFPQFKDFHGPAIRVKIVLVATGRSDGSRNVPIRSVAGLCLSVERGLDFVHLFHCLTSS